MQTNDLFGGRLKLRHLVLLTTIAEQGSFVAAAKALYITQPAVTRSVRELEDLVGADLFVRHPRGVSLTPYGEILLDHAGSALGNLRRATEQMEDYRRGQVRPLAIGTNLAGAYALLPNAIVALKRDHPDVAVSVLEGGAEELNSSLLRSEIDLFVGRLDSQTFRGALHHMRLYDEPVRLVVRRGHPALDAPEDAHKELLAFPWILPLHPSQLHDEIRELFTNWGLPLPQDIIECSTILTLRTILLETDAIAPLPMLIGLREELLDMLPARLPTVPRAIGVTLPADRSVSLHARRLIDALRTISQMISTELGPH